MIVTLAQRPDLIPPVAAWLWDEWGRHKGRTVAMVEARLAARQATTGPEQTFVRLHGGVPVATASLVHDDLDPRPDLTPWLASVYVDPPHRGKGHAVPVILAVEAAARTAGIATLWLHTEHAAGLYKRLGWVPVGNEVDHGHPVMLMRRDLTVPS